MSTVLPSRLRVSLTAKVAILVLTIVVLALAVTSLIIGHNPGLKSATSSTLRLSFAVLDSKRARNDSRGQFTNVFFLHHSVGRNLIEQGGVRQKFAEAGFSFWDQGYNWERVIDPNGNITKYSYNVPGDNTDPDGLAQIFAQPVYGLPLNTMSGLLQHEVIAFKSCYPTSNIRDDQQLARYKTYYLDMRAVMDKHADKVFIILTPPPLNPSETNSDEAIRAKSFADWLKSDEYLKGHPNIFTFDLFGYLAEGDPASPERYMLKAAYRDGTDSHPNREANETIGPLLVDFVIQSAQSYRTVHAGVVHQ